MNRQLSSSTKSVWEALSGNFVAVAVAVLVLMPLVTGLLTDAVHEALTRWTSDWPTVWRFVFIFGLAVLVGAIGIGMLYRYTERFVRPKVSTIPGDALQPRQVIIAFLSTVSPYKIEKNFSAQEDGEIGRSMWKVRNAQNNAKNGNGQGTGGDQCVDIGSLKEWAENPKPLTSWQQLARSLWFHHQGGHLRHVVLITSKPRTASGPNGCNIDAGADHTGSTPAKSTSSDRGSDDDADLAIQLFSDLLNRNGGPPVQVHKGVKCPVDFESLEELLESLSGTLRFVNDKLRISDDQIVIDVTGGQKTTSIAGALATINRRELIFQYMPTGANSVSIKPKAYQAITKTSLPSV